MAVPLENKIGVVAFAKGPEPFVEDLLLDCSRSPASLLDEYQSIQLVGVF